MFLKVAYIDRPRLNYYVYLVLFYKARSQGPFRLSGIEYIHIDTLDE